MKNIHLGIIGVLVAGLAACTTGQRMEQRGAATDGQAGQQMLTRSDALRQQATEKRTRADQRRHEAQAARQAGDVAHAQELTRDANDLVTQASQDDREATLMSQEAERRLNLGEPPKNQGPDVQNPGSSSEGTSKM